MRCGVTRQTLRSTSGLDQPNSALDQNGRAAEKFTGETHILIGLARTYDMLNALLRGVSFYKTLRCR